MFRLVLLILLVFAFTGASATSGAHDLNLGSDNTGHHAEMAGGDTLADAEKTLADCCDTTGGMGSAACFGDLANEVGVLPMAPPAAMTGRAAHASPDFSSLTLAVPIGPPKA